MNSEFFKLATCQTDDETIALGTLLDSAARENIRTARSRAFDVAAKGRFEQRSRALVSVVADLISHGWKLKLAGRDLLANDLCVPANSNRRESVRQVQMGQRDQQLRKASVREFVRSMEKKRLGPQGWTSVFSLMRDGQELADALRTAEKHTEIVPSVIKPYIQVIENPKQTCQFTGLRLMDIWRYFRYTWAMPYNSVPGRSMLVLIRDAAVPNHPVMGIAAFGSAIVQLSQRDSWIGWTASRFLAKLREHPTRSTASWVLRQINALTNAIYRADLVKSGVLTRRELKSPTEDTIARLLKRADQSWTLHRRFPDQSGHKVGLRNDNKHWKNQALSPLFKAKRCETLARLLHVRKVLNDCRYQPTTESLRHLVESSVGRRALEILLRAAKAEHVGIDMMDITICGAVAPYNPILGGKLTAMLLCSPEIVRAYRKRYKEGSSIIASSMAGKNVQRPPRLVLMGTTSLYGERLNQYHRIQIPAGVAGAKDAVRYAYLGESAGFGSSHLCRETVAELELVLAQSDQGRRVNSIFGEGVSPRLRKIRDGLDELGLPADRILNHGNPRLLYGVPLASNFRDVLTGLDAMPNFLFPQQKCSETTNAIAQYWCKRWLPPRLENHPEVIDAVAANDIRIPDRHSARVNLPELDTESLPLFA